MALKDELPGFVKGSEDLGGQLRELLAVVVKLCEAEEARSEAAALAAQEAPEGGSAESAADEAPATEAPAPKAPAKAPAK